MISAMQICLFAIKDLLRNKWTLIFAAFFLVVTIGLLEMLVDSTKVTISLINIVLYTIPLITVIFGTTYFYNSRDFTKFLLAQPVGRSHVFIGLSGGVVLSLCFGFSLGITVPFLFYGYFGAELWITILLLVLLGMALIMVFSGISFLISLLYDDKGRGLGAAILVWLFFAVVYDGILLLAANYFSEYPIEKALLGAIMLNPIDLSRILLIFRLDLSALMGYTGAVFRRFFSDGLGVTVAAASLLLWCVIPSSLCLLKLRSKDY